MHKEKDHTGRFHTEVMMMMTTTTAAMITMPAFLPIRPTFMQHFRAGAPFNAPRILTQGVVITIRCTDNETEAQEAKSPGQRDTDWDSPTGGPVQRRGTCGLGHTAVYRTKNVPGPHQAYWCVQQILPSDL